MKIFRRIFIIALFWLLFTGCSSTQNSLSEPVAEPPALPSAVAAPVQAEEEEAEAEVEATQPAPTETPSPTQPEEESAVHEAQAASPTPPQILHVMVPQQSRYNGNQILVECNTGYNYAASSNYVIPKACDSWRNNLLERPISQDLQTFFPYIDILSAMAGMDNDWYFISLSLFDASMPEDGSAYHYFAEIDSDFDGRGDFLLAVENLDLSSGDWTVEGVRAWQDTNKDVGSTNAVYADKSNLGDGYETLLFDQGLGDDPDLVWARRSPNSPKMIDLAFKKSLLDGKASFMWWVGALKGDLDPSQFDLVDSYDEDSYFAVDTTCGWLFGRNGKGYLKQCYIPEPTPVPTSVSANAPSCIKPPKPNDYTCWVWVPEWCEWVCFN